jgi:aspartyl-tRNA(Asn)/glutamyl-tRNA(Gln) amidotransferase subunit C
MWDGKAGPHLTVIMKLSKEEVLKIAELAKLELKPPEVEKFRGQLSDVLSYIGKLKELDTSKVKPTSQVTGLKNVFRKDSKIDSSRYIKSKKGKYFETEVVL